MKAAKDKIKKFISQFFGDRDLQDDEDIFALGFVDSMFTMQLVLFIEKEFEVTIENEDLEFSNFRSINSMTALLERKNIVLARD
ncbi:MAG: acyl carrier protein [Oscillatoriales cyanobacterium]|uniref:acyl carrier protein n=1 Tax=unclassified Microcoleus TaxID=2642155 RepID=UPI001D749FFA|nr:MULTISPECIES: phosphopantetheine-binding protein [unclassified Microcoleus]TAG08050.1 MAG: acyl carrier protein [Oscillatoriales cyanobacterium]MCC3434010.1 acyl carrier protein [Microcoleus sp. PH2017_05_CCC_O_A]MCC3583553.1 acyl carrier protein [Microcoleus sp. PH2017_30_WIL_O_A]TAG17497.1 MAG: acyl carrier protein [Oscillatoriales cyanobacterium]TAG45622.1 MAG: acyl carrier protein [Oscillatoriales cyanobacterium]